MRNESKMKMLHAPFLRGLKQNSFKLYAFVLAIFSATWLNGAMGADNSLITFDKYATCDIFQTNNNGHATGNIIAMALSKDKSILWTATDIGLEKRNGITGEFIQPVLSESLTPVIVSDFVPDGEGGIWVPSSSGLKHFDKKGEWREVNQGNIFFGRYNFNFMEPDGTGGLWIADYFNVYHFDGSETWRRVDSFEDEKSVAVFDKLQEYQITAVESDNNGGIWIVGVMIKRSQVMAPYHSCLFHYDGFGKWRDLSNCREMSEWEVWDSLAGDNEGGVWLADEVITHREEGSWFYEMAVKRYVLDGQGNITLQNTCLPSFAAGVVIDTDGVGGVWAGEGLFGELAYYDGGTSLNRITVDETPQLSGPIKAVLDDGGGGVWIGTSEELAHYDGKGNWIVHRQDDDKNVGIPDNNITALQMDNEDGLWIGTRGGLAHYDPGENWNVFTDWKGYDGAIAQVWVDALETDGLGGLWIGRYCSIAHIDNDNEWETHMLAEHDCGANSVEDFAHDGGGGVWACTRESIAHNDGSGHWELFKPPADLLPEPADYDNICLDDKGGVWAGTLWGNVVHYDNAGNWEVFPPSAIGHRDLSQIRAIEKGGGGEIWVGTYDGLGRYKGNETWEFFPGDDLHAYQLLFNGADGVWVGTDMGVVFHDGVEERERFTVLNSGLPRDDITALESDKSGGLWIGTPGGLAHLTLFGIPEYVSPEETEVRLSWFLNRSPLEYLDVQYFELQRSLAKEGPYNTVIGRNQKPVRFEADYSDCGEPRQYDCWPEVEGHTPHTINSGDTLIRGYTLDKPVVDPEWMEGLPRYYRISAVIAKDAKLFRAANNQETVLVIPKIRNRPRAILEPARSRMVMAPGESIDIPFAVASRGLFAGRVEISHQSVIKGVGSSISKDRISLQSGEDVQGKFTITAGETASGEVEIPLQTIILEGDGEGIGASLSIQVTRESAAVLGYHQVYGEYPEAGKGITLYGNIRSVEEGKSVSIHCSDLTAMDVDPDKEGFFETTVIPVHAGDFTCTAGKGSVTSEKLTIPVRKGSTRLAVSSDVNPGTAKGDILSLTGTVFPPRPGRAVSVKVAWRQDNGSGDETQTLLFNDQVSQGGQGEFRRSFTVPGDGFLLVEASVPETEDYQGALSPLTIPLGQPVGQGIIVVPDLGSTSFRRTSESLGRKTYNTLLSRNIPVERIRLLAKDLDGAFGEPTLDSFKQSLTLWARGLFLSEAPFKTPLTLYLLGFSDNVSEGTAAYRLNGSETLTAESLAGWLAELERGLGSEQGLPVNIILEGPRSGSWIKPLSGPGRFIITSSSDSDLGHGGYAGLDGFGAASFSSRFFQFVNYGYDVEGCFAEAELFALREYRKKQQPQLEADGDGIPGSTKDRYRSRQKYLEYRPLGNLRPLIDGVNMPGKIPAGGKELYAVVSDPENDALSVYCDIRSPGGAFRRLSLEQLDGKRYGFFLGDFPEAGTYEMVFHAVDPHENVSLPRRTRFFVENPMGNSWDEEPGAPASPLVLQTIYRDGDRLRVTLPTLPEGEKQYLALAVPNSGSVLLLTGLNRPTTFDGSTLPQWEGETEALDLTVSLEIPRGDYLLYLLRVPMETPDPLAETESWRLGSAMFAVE